MLGDMTANDVTYLTANGYKRTEAGAYERVLGNDSKTVIEQDDHGWFTVNRFTPDDVLAKSERRQDVHSALTVAVMLEHPF